MLDTLTRYLATITEVRWRSALRSILAPLVDRYSTQALTSAGLVIKDTSETVAKTGSSAFYALVNGKLVSIAGSTDMPALVGSITAGKYNVFVFFVDAAGTVSVAMGTEGAAIGNVVWPPIPENKAVVGALLITYASTFVGGTTALDTATTVYLSPTGPFDPSVLIG